MKDKVFGGIMGLVVGDALGVPVEFVSRRELKQDPVTTMQEYGTYHQPKGTWSDDSSMTLCLVESLIYGLSYEDMAKRFFSWMLHGYMTPHGEMFDIGGATAKALRRFGLGANPLECGGSSQRDNGNGSLMRILPLAFYTMGMEPKKRFEIISNVSKITHAHERSISACGMCVEMAIGLLKGYSKEKAYRRMVKDWQREHSNSPENKTFARVLSGKLMDLQEEDISSTGYVVDTLEAALWCLLTTDNYQDCVLKAVNLGEDTDTTAAVAGGLAGILYGYQAIPKDWVDAIVKKEEILSLCEGFHGVCKPFEPFYRYTEHFERFLECALNSERQEEGGCNTPYPSYERMMREFEQRAYDLGVMDYEYIETLDRYGWDDSGRVDGLIQKANVELTLALLTYHIRAQRSRYAPWSSIDKEGIFAAIVKRLKEIEEEWETAEGLTKYQKRR